MALLPFRPGVLLLAGVTALCGHSLFAGGYVEEGNARPPRGADELYWVPTLEQAQEMAQATGRPILLMGYSLVGDGSTYTRLADEFCTGVY